MKQSREAEEELLRHSPSNFLAGRPRSLPSEYSNINNRDVGNNDAAESRRRRSAAVEEEPRRLLRGGPPSVASGDELSPFELTERGEWDWGQTRANGGAAKGSSDSLASLGSDGAGHGDHHHSPSLAPPTASHHLPISSTLSNEAFQDLQADCSSPSLSEDLSPERSAGDDTDSIIQLEPGGRSFG
jgi:hypothetical protein